MTFCQCFLFLTNLILLSIYFRMIRLLACNQSKNDTCLNHPFWVSALSPDNHGCLVFPLADSSHCLLPLRFGRSGKTSGRSKRFIQVIYRFNKVLYKYLQVLPGFYPGFYHAQLIAAIAYRLVHVLLSRFYLNFFLILSKFYPDEIWTKFG